MATRRHLFPISALAIVALALGSFAPAQAQPLMSMSGDAPPRSAADGTPFGQVRRMGLPVDELAQIPAHLFGRGGSLAIYPVARFQRLYSSGLPGAAGADETTYVDTASIGATLRLGKDFGLNYAAQWTGYSESSLRDTLSHVLTFDGAYSLPAKNWVVQIAQDYGKNDTVLIETGRQTKVESSNTVISGVYRAKGGVTIDLTLKQDLEFVEGSPDVQQWTAVPGLRFIPRSDLQFGLGMDLGYMRGGTSSDTRLIQPSVQFSWTLSEKTSLNLQGGWAELRPEEGGSPYRQGFASAGVSYQPGSTTALSLSYNQGVSASRFQAQSASTTGLRFSLSQRLFGSVQATGAASWETSDYLVSGPFVVNRSDEVFTYSFRVSVPIFRWITLGFSYVSSENDSDLSDFGFENEQIGIEVQVRY